MVDFGKLTEEETAALAVEALGELRLDARVKAVIAAFSEEADRDELMSWLDDERTKPITET